MKNLTDYTPAAEEEESIRFRVAEKIGWREIGYNRDGCLIGHPPGLRSIRTIPSYCQDIRATWEIIKLLTSHHIYVRIRNVFIQGDVRRYEAIIGKENNPHGISTDRRPEVALCKAFLQISDRMLDDTRIKTIVKGEFVSKNQ